MRPSVTPALLILCASMAVLACSEPRNNDLGPEVARDDAGGDGAGEEGLAVLEITAAADVPAYSGVRFSIPGRKDIPAQEVAAAPGQALRFRYALPGPSGKTLVRAQALSVDRCAVGEGFAEVELELGRISAAVPLFITRTPASEQSCFEPLDAAEDEVEPTSDASDDPADVPVNAPADAPADRPTPNPDARADAPRADAAVDKPVTPPPMKPPPPPMKPPPACFAATHACPGALACCAGLACATTSIGRVCCGNFGNSCTRVGGEDCCGQLECVSGRCCLPAVRACHGGDCCGGLVCGNTSAGHVCCGNRGAPCTRPGGEDCCGALECIHGHCG